MMNTLRALVFYFIFSIWTIFFGTLVVCGFFLPHGWLWSVIACWRTGFNILCRTVLGFRYRVLGLENLPRQPSIMLAKHQSAWETIALQQYAPQPVFVMKRELFFLPFLGWGLKIMGMIGIDRKSKLSALAQIVEQGKARLAKGRWIIMFPEGTRVLPGQKKPYQRGGAHLAVKSGALVVPVAHNAGEFWPKRSFVKKTGTITLSFGVPIDPAGLNESQIIERVENWIEAEVRRISPELYSQADK